MIASEKNGLKYYQFDLFNRYGIKHALFTRQGGVSPVPFDSLNTASTVGDSEENVFENLTRMFNVFGLDIYSRYDGWMCHSKTVICTDVPRDIRRLPIRADGLVTDNPKVTLVQRYADCVPVMLCDLRRRVVGICHAGWKGTVDNICAITIRRMNRMYGCEPADMIAGIGPAIGPDHFVVKEDVAGPFRAAFGSRYDRISDLSSGEIRLNLWEANRMRLADAGVPQIEVAEICTVCHKDEWFSHRGDHGKSGRFGALITLG